MKSFVHLNAPNGLFVMIYGDQPGLLCSKDKTYICPQFSIFCPTWIVVFFCLSLTVWLTNNPALQRLSSQTRYRKSLLWWLWLGLTLVKLRVSLLACDLAVAVAAPLGPLQLPQTRLPMVQITTEMERTKLARRSSETWFCITKGGIYWRPFCWHSDISFPFPFAVLYMARIHLLCIFQTTVFVL